MPLNRSLSVYAEEVQATEDGPEIRNADKLAAINGTSITKASEAKLVQALLDDLDSWTGDRAEEIKADLRGAIEEYTAQS